MSMMASGLPMANRPGASSLASGWGVRDIFMDQLASSRLERVCGADSLSDFPRPDKLGFVMK